MDAFNALYSSVNLDLTKSDSVSEIVTVWNHTIPCPKANGSSCPLILMVPDHISYHGMCEDIVAKIAWSRVNLEFQGPPPPYICKSRSSFHFSSALVFIAFITTWQECYLFIYFYSLIFSYSYKLQRGRDICLVCYSISST